MKIIFDLDGTLLDSRQRHIEVLKDCLDEIIKKSYPIQDFVVFKAKGYSTYNYLNMKLGLSDSTSHEISARWAERIENINYLEFDKLYKDSMQALEFLYKNNQTLYLLTARKNKIALFEQIGWLKIKNYFEIIKCVSPYNAKNEKKSFLEGISAELMVGDTEVDIEASTQAQIPCYILNRGFRNKDFWDKKNLVSYPSLDIKWFADWIKNRGR